MQIANNLPKKILTEGKANITTIAPNEASPSTRAYNVDDYLYYNEVFYKVITPISIGDALTINSNISLTTVGEELAKAGNTNTVYAPHEVSPSENDYSIGDYLTYNNVIYEVTSNISDGDMLIANTNIEEADIETGTIIFYEDGSSVIYESGSSGDGHTIVNSSGSTMPQRSKLKFLGVTVTDDSEDNTTIIDIKTGTTIVQIPTITNNSFTYNGTEQGPTITWATGMEDNCIVTNAVKTDAGDYTLTIALKNTSKMVWSDMTTADLTYSWSIAKATSDITIDSNSVTLDNDHLSATVTVGNVLGRTLSASSSDTTVATTSINDNIVTISSVNQKKGTPTITITAAQSTNYNASSKIVSVTADVLKIVSWANGTDGEIADMIAAAYAGDIDIADYWSVGDERTVHLAGNINEDVKFVIEDLNNTTSGGTEYKVAVGQKNGLSTTKQMNSSNTNSGGYNSSAMKSFIEGDYQTALQNATTGNFWEAVKSATHKSQIYSSGLQSTTAKVILHSIFETNSNNTFYNNNSWSQYMPDETTANGFHQFEWYKTSGNRIKKQGESGSANDSWSRSASANGSGGFWFVRTDGTADYTHASYSRLVAPFCVL